MTAQILDLINKSDNFELVGLQVAAILAVESANQKTLAPAPTYDARLWELRVYYERSNPFSEFIDAPEQRDGTPIVNVHFDNSKFDMSSSNIVERQRATGTFQIDCYGYGVSTDSGNVLTGHDPGDARAALEAKRAARLVRNIVMAGAYAYLGFPRATSGASQIVWRRWVDSITLFEPTIDDRPVPHVMGCRVSLQVDFSEFSPQVPSQALELVALTVKRAEDGRVLLTANIDTTI